MHCYIRSSLIFITGVTPTLKCIAIWKRSHTWLNERGSNKVHNLLRHHLILYQAILHHSDFMAAPAPKRQVPTIAGRKMVSIMIVTPIEGPTLRGMIPKLQRNTNIAATRSKTKPISFRRFFFVFTRKNLPSKAVSSSDA